MKASPRHIALAALICIAVLGVLAPFIANDHVLLAKSPDGELHWLSDSIDGPYAWAIVAPVPFSASTIDKYSTRWRPPGYINARGQKHLLGTTKLGKDVLAGCLYGARTALSVGLLAMVITTLIGLVLGIVAGYYGDRLVETTALRLVVLTLLAVAVLLMLGLGMYYNHIPNVAVAAVLTVVWLICYRMLPTTGQKVYVAIDSSVMRLIEIRKSIPVIYLVIVATALVAHHNIWTLAAVIGCLIWTGIARFTRVYTMELVSESQIVAARSIGLSDVRVMLVHILPQLWPQIKVLSVFAVSSSILLEASLSYLGLGMPVDTMTWGMLISEAKQNPAAWWLALIPGTLISITLIALNTLTDDLRL